MGAEDLVRRHSSGDDLAPSTGAVLVHAGMNIADKGAVFAEVRRVLADGGCLRYDDPATVTRAPDLPR